MKTKKKKKTGNNNKKTPFQFSILNSVTVGVAAVDKTGKIIFMNNKIVDMWGYTREELIGKRFNILKIITPASMGKTLAAFAKGLTGKHDPVFEIEIKDKNGNIRTVEIQGASLKKNNKIIGTIATLVDRTKQKEAEEQLKKRNEELESFNKLAVGRELRIDELKKKVKELEKKVKAGEEKK